MKGLVQSWRLTGVTPVVLSGLDTTCASSSKTILAKLLTLDWQSESHLVSCRAGLLTLPLMWHRLDYTRAVKMDSGKEVAKDP